MDAADRVMARLLAMNTQAYRVAVRVMGRSEGAEDAVQQAYLAAVQQLRSGPPPAEERAWFLSITANQARRLLRTEAQLRRRRPPMLAECTSGPDTDTELIAALRRAMQALEEKYRLPLALCYEENLSQREAALILEIPESTMADRLQSALERLRSALGRAGYRAAPAAMIGALAHTAPAVPASLAAVVEKIVSGQVTAVGSGAGSAGAAVGVAAKGGMAMKAILAVVLAGTVAAGAAGLSAFGLRPSEPRDTGSGPAAAVLATGENPVGDRQEREEVFEFTQKPMVTKQGDPSTSSGQGKWIIAFASKGKCDATVAIVDKDGKIVRHLASGVLGKNAPWPFKQDSLAQSLEWDGKDDFGKPAPAGCKVRVGLGVKYTYERSMGWEPASFATPVQNILVAKDGTAYVVAAGVIKAFDRGGKYLRTVFPPQGGVDVSGAFPMHKTAYGDSVMHSDWMGPFSSVRGNVGTCALTGDGGQLLVHWVAGPFYPANLIKIDTKTGALPPGSVVNLGHTYENREKAGLQSNASGDNYRVSIAVAPDGETVYFSGTQHAVFRAKLTDLKHRGSLVWLSRGEKIAPETMPRVFLGENGKPGTDNAHFNMSRGVAVDKEGNIYVGDHMNNRIQVFKPDGTYLRTIQVQAPQELVVHPKTGDMYVLCWRSGDVEKPPKPWVLMETKIVKILKDGTISPATISIKSDWSYWHNPVGVGLGLDATSDEPAIWVAGKEGVRRLVDKGNSFVEAARIAGAAGVGLASGTHRLAVDRETETLYASNGVRIFNPTWHRFDGNTGKRDESFKGAPWEDMVIAADGTIICRSPGYGPFVMRYDRDMKPRPFKKGVVSKDVGGGWPADGPVLYCGVKGHSNVYQDGMTVNPVNGDIYVRAKEIYKSWYDKMVPGGKSLPPEELAKLVDWLPPDYVKRGPHSDSSVLLVWDRDGNPKSAQAITGLWRGSGIRVSRAGDAYVSIGCAYGNGGYWEGLAEPDKSNLTAYRTFGNLGVIFKFLNDGRGSFGTMTGKSPKAFTGVAWEYRGHAPSQPKDCGCCHSLFGSDGFDRLYVPAMHLYSVMVLDANGNVIMRLGRYGNADGQGKGSLAPEPDIALSWVLAVEASDRALYISDQGNQRILKAAIGYAVEEAVPAP
jgi:RNA polymerase sigma-70 factor (ECF subfamily)